MVLGNREHSDERDSPCLHGGRTEGEDRGHALESPVNSVKCSVFILRQWEDGAWF